MKTIRSVVKNEDSYAALALIPDDYFDLAVVDPPYGINSNSHRQNNRSKLAKSKKYHPAVFEQKIPDRYYFDQLRRISKNQIIFGGNYFMHHLPPTNCMIIWDKCNGDSNYADCEIAWTSFQSKSRIFKFLWNGMLHGDPMNPEKSIGNNAKKQKRIHPTEKPIELYNWIFKNYLPEGGKVIDTHIGSGSIRIAASNFDIDLIGYEIEKKYYDDQEKRFSEYISQLNLFEHH